MPWNFIVYESNISRGWITIAGAITTTLRRSCAVRPKKALWSVIHQLTYNVKGSAGITSALIIFIPLSQEKRIRLLPRREYMFSSCWYFRLLSSSHMMLSPLWDAKRRYFHNRIDRWFLNIVNSNVSWYACWLIHHSISTLWSQEISTHDGLRDRMQSDPNSSPLSEAIVRPFPLSLWIEGAYRKLARSYMKLLML